MIIQSGLVYLTRKEWGADTTIPRLGSVVARSDRTEAIFHHTVIVDSDTTKNRWTTLTEVKAKMRQLQVIRPDLGLDVPYNFVMFLMEDGAIVVCEGRGLNRSGAHTRGHNYAGMATALQGNFMLPINLSPHVSGMSRWLGWLRYDKGMDNLGEDHPAGRIAYGHRDFASTGCPGDNLYDIILQLTFKKEGLTVEQYQELKKRIAEAEELHKRNRGYRRQVGKLVGQVSGLLAATNPAAVQTILTAAKKQATVIGDRVRKGSIVP